MIGGYRITKAGYAPSGRAAFDGAGGLKTDGRWHSRGRRIAYASSNLALAAMEYLVHVSRADAPSNLVFVKVEVPDEIQMDRLTIEDLPPDWRALPAPDSLQEIGDRWTAGRTSVCLLVPSAVIAIEDNLLINPVHPDFDRLLFSEPAPFVFDERFLPHPLP